MAAGGVALVSLGLLCAGSYFAFRWIGGQLREGGDHGMDVAAFEERFQAACLERCEAAGPEEGCPAYCQCRFERMRGERSPEDFVAWATRQVTPDGGASDALATVGDRADLECGGRLLELGFLEQCQASCTAEGAAGGGCRTYCECTFAYLRRGMDEAEADRWWLEHLAGSEFTEEGEQAFQAAVDHCVRETGFVPSETGVSTDSGP
ncbi:MAG: hypothetical protein ACODAU_11020 [Myxococcota bacterium]